MNKARVGELCDILNGFAFKSANYVDNGIRIIRIANVQKGYIVDDAPEYYPLSAENTISNYMLYSGDLLMSLTGNVGRVGILDSELLPAALNQRVACIRIKNEEVLDKQYLFYLFYGNYFENQCIISSKGIAQKNMSTEWLKKYKIPLPDISTQRQIATTLDKASELIALHKNQLEELDTLAESVFYDMFKDAKTEIKELWQVLDVQNGLVDPTIQPYSNMIHVGGANIESNSGNIVNVKLAKEENLISGKYYFNETMVLYSKIRPNLNKVALPLQKGICSADMYPLIPKLDKINRVFLRYILIQSDFLEYAISHSGRANIPKINRKDLLRYKLPLPPLSLQTRFATIIEKIEEQKALAKKALQESEDLFQRLMQDLFKPD